MEGTYVLKYLWLIHVDVWQKPTQYYKAIIFQVEINNLKKLKMLTLDNYSSLDGGWAENMLIRCLKHFCFS